MDKIWPPDPNKPRPEYKPSEFISEWDSEQKKVITKDRAIYWADKHSAASKDAKRYFGVALIAGFAALWLLVEFVYANSLSKVACSVVQTVYDSVSEEDEEKMTPERRKQREAVERAYEKCENHGVYE